MLFAGGVASTSVSAVQLTASYSGKTTKAQDVETNKATGTVLSLSSPGGLVGGTTGLVIGGEEGLAKGALIGGLAEGVVSLGAGFYRLRPGPGLSPEPIAEASVKEWQAMNSAQRKIYERGQLALRQGAYDSLKTLSPMARGRELESLGLGGTLKLADPLKLPWLLSTGPTAGARLVGPSFMDALHLGLDPNIYLDLQFQNMEAPDTRTNKNR